MDDSHRHLVITEEEWGAFTDDLRRTLNKFDVPPPEQEEMKVIIESTHDAIVISRLQSATPWREAGRDLPPPANRVNEGAR